MRKLGRTIDQRKALMKSLAANLIMKGKIKTTEARAKDLRSVLEPLITKTKAATLASQRLAVKSLPAAAAKKLVKEIAPSFKGRNGGYVRLTRLGQRMSDGAKIVFIELIK